MRSLRSWLSVGLIVLVLAGCSSGAAPSTAATSGSPPAGASDAATTGSAASSPPADPVVWLPEWADESLPDQVANRRPLPFCGVERAPQPQPGIFIDRAVRLCFWNAHLAGSEAEFVSLQSTMEGNPIATVYRLAADGSVEVLTDFTQDPFGGGVWMSTACAAVVEVAGNELLGVDQCAEGVTLE